MGKTSWSDGLKRLQRVIDELISQFGMDHIRTVSAMHDLSIYHAGYGDMETAATIPQEVFDSEKSSWESSSALSVVM